MNALAVIANLYLALFQLNASLSLVLEPEPPAVVMVPCPQGSEPVEDFPYTPMVASAVNILSPAEDSPPELLPDYARVDQPPKSSADCLLPRAFGPCTG